VGIENPAETAGLQLLYNGTFDSRTWLIGPRAAVRFTTRTHGRTGTLTGRIIAHPPETDLTQATVHVGESSVSPNASGQFSANSLLTGVHRPCVTLAGFETVRAEILIGADSTSNLELRLWRLDPPRNLTATTASLPLVPLRWESPLSAVAPHGLDEFSEYVVYRNGIALTAVADTFYTDTLITTGFYSYYVVAAYDGGLSGSSNQVAVEYSSGIAEEIASLPTEFTLRPCYPNPFNPSTTVRFGMPSAAEVRIEVFDVLGRRVTTLAEETFRPGWHDVIWDCRSCPTGMYVLRLQTGEKVLLGKMLLMK
ncbi:T9SS type A sorting domain-containing protein, partial [bacterium]|nr:T9SS type A sorting domain-containing protein [bacterium]